MSGGPRMVIGRVVSMEHGRATIASPIGPPVPYPSVKAEQVAQLIAAARAYKKQRNEDTLRGLSEAALDLD